MHVSRTKLALCAHAFSGPVVQEHVASCSRGSSLDSARADGRGGAVVAHTSGQLSPTLLIQSPSSTKGGEEHLMKTGKKNLTGGNKDREVTPQFPLQTRETQLKGDWCNLLPISIRLEHWKLLPPIHPLLSPPWAVQENGGCGQPLTLISAPTPCGSLPQGYSPSTTDPRWASTAAALQALLSKVRPPATKPLWHKPHTDAGPMVMLDWEHQALGSASVVGDFVSCYWAYIRTQKSLRFHSCYWNMDTRSSCKGQGHYSAP